MKRLVSLTLALVLMASLAPTALAASDEAINAANALYNQGLFSGTGTDTNGNPNFDLDRAPTRHEAVTMLVRLLDKSNEAESGTWNTPFTDVADWAKPYVGYAYTNGLTSGTSATTYGGDQPVTASQYLTFVLRALGYQVGTDFQWDKAWELSDKIGLTNGEYTANTTNFTRGDVAIISNKSLMLSHTTTPTSPKNENINFKSLQGLWGGINRTDTGKITECYRFDGTNYNCAYILSDKDDTTIAMCYEEGTFYISDNTITFVRSKEYTYRGNGSQTQVSEEVKSLEYNIDLVDNMFALNNFVYKNYVDDAETKELISEMYDTIKTRVMEHLTSGSPSENYSYLVSADFRSIRRQYPQAVAQYGYALPYTDLNGDNCVLTIVYYKIINNYNVVTLHNLTQNKTFENPTDYYNRFADRAYGSDKIRYWNLSAEAGERTQNALKAILDVLQTGNNTGSGVFVGPEILNQ